MIAWLTALFSPRPKGRLRVRFAHAEGRGEWVGATPKNIANIEFLVGEWNKMDGKETNWVEYER